MNGKVETGSGGNDGWRDGLIQLFGSESRIVLGATELNRIGKLRSRAAVSYFHLVGNDSVDPRLGIAHRR